MKQITILVIPDKGKRTKRFIFPLLLLKLGTFLAISVSSILGYLAFDYKQLREIRENHFKLIAENQHLKGEAQILMNSLEEVKYSLGRVRDYTIKLDELVNLKVKKVSKRIGIGPLSPEEYSTLQKDPSLMNKQSSFASVPMGINIDNLIFKPVLGKLDDINHHSNQQALELQKLLSTLSQKKSILYSVPSAAPVKGWIASSFGIRISPFTGARTLHKGIDIAAPVGTPIRAPADGVVIFSGAKAGFGNFIMLAHYGYGVVTRYGHNAQNMVHVGQKIDRGDQIATVGMTGRTTGPHLHYEVWVDGKAVNPRKFILE